MKANAAAALCPAWDLATAFTKLQNKYPLLDKFLTREIIRHFLNAPRNQSVLMSSMPDVVSKAKQTNSLNDFMSAAAPLAGCADFDDFMKENNPKGWAEAVALDHALRGGGRIKHEERQPEPVDRGLALSVERSDRRIWWRGALCSPALWRSQSHRVGLAGVA